jgi:hypothetical protein
MTPIEQFRKLVDAWCAATGGSYGGLSARIFNRDGSRLGRIMAGADVTTTTHWNAVIWLADHWPKGTPWPAGVERPQATAETEVQP